MKNYQSTGSRDPIWTQVACDPEDGLRVSHERVRLLLLVLEINLILKYVCGAVTRHI